MFETLGRSWKLTKISWRILMADKELLLFPVLSGLGAIALFLGIVLPFAFISGAGGEGGIRYSVLFLWYFAASFVTIFFQSALVACVKKRMSGGDPTLSYGLKEAAGRIVPILGWSLISATVGLLLRMLADRARGKEGVAGIVAQVVVSMVGFAWTIVTMFVVPVLVVEKKGVFESLKRSGALVRKTWGEQVVMKVGLGYIFGFIYAGLVLLLILITLAAPGIFLPVLLLVLLLIAVTAVLHSSLNGVFSGVLYSYAVGDSVPAEFKREAEGIFEQERA